VGVDAGTDIAVLKVDAEGIAVSRRKATPVPGNLAFTVGRAQDSASTRPWNRQRGKRILADVAGRAARPLHPARLTLYPQSTGSGNGCHGRGFGIATPALSRIAGYHSGHEYRAS